MYLKYNLKYHIKYGPKTRAATATLIENKFKLLKFSILISLIPLIFIAIIHTIDN